MIHSSSGTTSVSSTDFEFINMSGKQASVAFSKEGFQWDGRAVKELSGTGGIYVRLTKNISIDTSSSDEELPEAPLGGQFYHSSRSDNEVHYSHSGCGGRSDRESANNLPLFDTEFSHMECDTRQSPHGSHIGGNNMLIDDNNGNNRSPPLNSGSSSLRQTGDNNDDHNSATTRGHNSMISCTVSHSTTHSCNDSEAVINLVTDDDENSASLKVDCSAADLTSLTEIFPDKSLGLLSLVFKLCSNSCLRAVDFLTSDPSFLSLRSLAADHIITTPVDESPRIRLDTEDEDEDWLTAALAFYKHNKFDKHASVRITIHGQPGIDTGGIRRQFFSVVFTHLVKSSATSLFEGPPYRLRPAYKATSLSSGMLSTLGTMVAHSILLDGQGFIFLAEYCYHYLTGNENMAITTITCEDVSLGIKEILGKV